MDNISDEDVVKYGIPILNKVTMEAARERLSSLFDWGFGSKDRPALIEALPAVGKSYGAVKWASRTGEPISIFTERHELYDQYEEWATDDFGLTTQQLPVFHQDCPTAKEPSEFGLGENNYAIRPVGGEDNTEDWYERVRRKYRQGISGRELHERATTYFGEELPCQAEDTCPYIDALDWNRDDVDVLIGNFRQVYVEQYRDDRYVVFDEFPKESFIQQFSAEMVSNTVSRFVSQGSDLPFENWDGVLEYDHQREQNPDVEEWLEKHSHDRDTRPLHRGTGGQINAHGPLLTEIGLRFERLDNGWRRADLGEGRVAVRSPNNNRVSLLDPPPTEESEGVVALDGTPCVEMWELLLGEHLRHCSVFTDEQKRRFITDVLKLQFVRTEDTTKPYQVLY